VCDLSVILCVSFIGLVVFILSILFVILTMDTLSEINLMDKINKCFFSVSYSRRKIITSEAASSTLLCMSEIDTVGWIIAIRRWQVVFLSVVSCRQMHCSGHETRNTSIVLLVDRVTCRLKFS